MLIKNFILWLKRSWVVIVIYMAIILLLISFCLHLDPDLGWHLRVGQDMLKNHQIPRFDDYTFAFKGYAWRDHEWLAEAPLYLMFKYCGYSSLVLFFSLLWFLPFWFHFKSLSSSKLFVITAEVFDSSQTMSDSRMAGIQSNEQLVNSRLGGVDSKNGNHNVWVSMTTLALLILMALYLCSPSIGVRLQALTLNGVVLLLYLFNRYQHGKRDIIYLYPIIMLLWANLHGSFVYGLLIGAVFLFSLSVSSLRSIALFLCSLVSFPRRRESRMSMFQWIPVFSGITSKKLVGKFKNHWQLALSFVCSILATLINPYGIGLWQEIIIASDPTFKRMISEWQTIFNPPLFYPVIGYLIIYCLFWLTNRNRKSQFPPYYHIITVSFLVLTLLSKRNAPIFILLSIPIFIERIKIDYLVKKFTISSFVYTFTQLLFAIIFIIKGVVMVPILIKNMDPFKNNWDNYPSQESLQYLKTLPAGTPVFASYDFGGYLIWATPNVKVFIDGRGSYWKLNNDLAVAKYFEVLKDFNKFQELQKDHQIKYILSGDLSSQIRYDVVLQRDLTNYIWRNFQVNIAKSGDWQELAEKLYVAK